MRAEHEFITDYCEQCEGSKIQASDLYKSFLAWCHVSRPKVIPPTQAAFGRYCGLLYEKKKVEGIVYYVDVAFRSQKTRGTTATMSVNEASVLDADRFIKKFWDKILELARTQNRLMDLEKENEELKTELKRKQLEIAELKRNRTDVRETMDLNKL